MKVLLIEIGVAGAARVARARRFGRRVFTVERRLLTPADDRYPVYSAGDELTHELLPGGNIVGSTHYWEPLSWGARRFYRS